MPASRSARATIFAPRSCPSSPGLPTRIRSLRPGAAGFGSLIPPPSRERSPDLPGCRLDAPPIPGDHRPVEPLPVPGEAGDEVQVEVWHRLERGGAVRLQQVEAVGPEGF